MVIIIYDGFVGKLFCFMDCRMCVMVETFELISLIHRVGFIEKEKSLCEAMDFNEKSSK